MACAGSSNPGGGGGGGDLPKTPCVIVKPDDVNVPHPDTVENVARQTDGIFRNFVQWMYNLYRTREGVGADDTPSLPEITAFVDSPLT